jgi:hypothetical protein
MYTRRPWQQQKDDRAEADRQTTSLAAFAVVLLLLVAGLFLVHELRSKASIEDCLMAGRRNCDRLIETPH